MGSKDRSIELLKLLGEIIQESIRMVSFKQVVKMLSEKCVRQLGVKNCYLWIASSENDEGRYHLYIRSVGILGELDEVEGVILPKEFRNLDRVKICTREEALRPIVKGMRTFPYRLVVPIEGTENDYRSMMAIEYEEPNCLSEKDIAFYEAIASFIMSKAESFRILRKAAETSIKDPLTETYNRRHLDEAIISMYNKYQHLTVAIIDTDNFKTINDELGHLQGDTVLKAIAQLTKGMMRDNLGEVVRYGGDEFIILLPKPLSEALHIFEAYRKAVHYLSIAYDLKMNISITLGVCACPEIIEDYTQLIEVADRALLRGKVQGKDRVVLATKEDAELN